MPMKKKEDQKKISERSSCLFVKLQEVAKIIMGQSPPGDTYNQIGEGLPFFQGVTDFGIRKPKKRVFCNVPKKIAQTGDILFSVRAPIGRINIAPEKCAIGRGIAAIQAYNQRDQQFIEFQLIGKKNDWKALESQGSLFGNAKKEDLENITIYWPDEITRYTISHTLDILQKKIELNNNQNYILERVAFAIFKSWFIDFDPVRAKALGQQPAIIDAETAAIFPNELVRENGREVPTGWGVKSLNESFNVVMGQSPPSTTYNEEGVGIPFFQGRADFNFRYPSIRVYCTTPSRFAEVGDTLVSIRAPVGDVNLTQERCCIGRGIAALRHKTGSRSFSYYHMLSLKNTFAQFESKGTVFGSISKIDLNQIDCITPSYDIVRKFEEIAFPIDQTILNNVRQSQILAESRDALLSKFMSWKTNEETRKIVGI
jgi:type I restriction enzyme S subunit